jgi:hypothetical protein
LEGGGGLLYVSFLSYQLRYQCGMPFWLAMKKIKQEQDEFKIKCLFLIIKSGEQTFKSIH